MLGSHLGQSLVSFVCQQESRLQRLGQYFVYGGSKCSYKAVLSLVEAEHIADTVLEIVLQPFVVSVRDSALLEAFALFKGE